MVNLAVTSEPEETMYNIVVTSEKGGGVCLNIAVTSKQVERERLYFDTAHTETGQNAEA